MDTDTAETETAQLPPFPYREMSPVGVEIPRTKPSITTMGPLYMGHHTPDEYARAVERRELRDCVVNVSMLSGQDGNRPVYSREMLEEIAAWVQECSKRTSFSEVPRLNYATYPDLAERMVLYRDRTFTPVRPCYPQSTDNDDSSQEDNATTVADDYLCDLQKIQAEWRASVVCKKLLEKLLVFKNSVRVKNMVCDGLGTLSDSYSSDSSAGQQDGGASSPIPIIAYDPAYTEARRTLPAKRWAVSTWRSLECRLESGDVRGFAFVYFTGPEEIGRAALTRREVLPSNIDARLWPASRSCEPKGSSK